MEKSKFTVYLVLEGQEEKYFFDIVKELGTDQSIDLLYDDVGGFGNVAPLYQDAISDPSYDCVLCVYDVDCRSSDAESPFNHILSELVLILGNKKAADLASFYTNPNILQMYLLGCDEYNNVLLHCTSKSKNTPIVHKYWDKIGRTKTDSLGRPIINEYDASTWQLEEMYYSYINNEYSYERLLENAQKLPSGCDECPSSKLYPLLKALKTGDIDYFKNINKQINKLSEEEE